MPVFDNVGTRDDRSIRLIGITVGPIVGMAFLVIRTLRVCQAQDTGRE